MNTPQPMTRDELIELAALDAFSLLDPYEAALYTRSFHHAPAAVQDEIIRLQAEIAGDESLLPVALPDLSLRDRVLSAVARAIERDSSHAPLAVIGKKDRQPAAADLRFRLPLSGRFWRAASFLLAGTVVVFGYFWTNALKDGNQIGRLALADNTAGQLEQLIGPTVTDFLFDSRVSHVAFEKYADVQCSAALLVNADTRQVFLITQGLPKSDNVAYVLEYVNESGARTAVSSPFSGSEPLTGARFDLPADLLLSISGHWEIRIHGAAEPILRA